MRSRSWFLAPLVGLLATLLAAPLPAAASGPLISGCTTITSPGGYLLTRDVATSTTGACIKITAPNVSLNLGGHTLTGVGMGTGVQIDPPATFARVVNGTVRQFFNGFDVDANNAVVLSVTANNNVEGISVFHSSGVTLAQDTVLDNFSFGIELEISSHNRVLRNTVTGNTVVGIDVLSGSTQNQIDSNTATQNGIDLKDGNANCDSNQWLANTFGTANQGCID